VVLGREDACVRLARHSPRLIPGIGPKTADRLAELGFHTIGHLQAATEEQLVERFGSRQGRYLKSRAQFHDATPVEPVSGPAKSRSVETTFDHDIGALEELETVLRRLAGELAVHCQEREARGRTIAIKVRLDDWTTVTRAKTLPAPVNDTATVTDVALELLRAYDPPRPVRLLGVRVASFEDVAAAPAADDGQLALPL
jgi:DNA polymerase IV